MMHGPQNIKFA